MKNYFHITVLILVVLLLPYAADACPLCQGGAGYNQQTLTAYKSVTAVLASLPLVMGGGIYWFIRRKFRNSEKEKE
ncbi:MAG TPA: hypothetical protein VII99_06475 [Bacteroidia bacterium]